MAIEEKSGRVFLAEKDNRAFLGVIGGICEHHNLDNPVIWRVGVVVLTIIFPIFTIVPYFVARLVMTKPEKHEKSAKSDFEDDDFFDDCDENESIGPLNDGYD